MHKYFNPKKIQNIITIILPYVFAATIILLALGLYYALFASPEDYQQGDYVRIMYVHVPSAWMALGIYVTIASLSAASLIWKSPVSTYIAIEAAPIGALFTAACLITGSIWGKPIWGSWWVWDARLTSMLILLFIYIGYISLYNAYDNKQTAGKIAAVFALLGAINIPIIKFSVDWWNTLHQPASILRSEGISIDSSMLPPLFLMFAAFMCFFILTLSLRVQTSLMDKKLSRTQ